MTLKSRDIDPLTKLFAMAAEDWRDRAACLHLGSSLFESSETEAAAKTFCQACHVRTDCLDSAMYFRDEYFVRGGLSEKDRALLLSQRRNSVKYFRYDTEAALSSVGETWIREEV